MTIVSKTLTALRLTARGDIATLRRQFSRNASAIRLRRNYGRPFVYHDDGCAYVCHPDWPDSVDHCLGAGTDRWETRLVRSWLRPGDSMIDAGTNIGVYAFAAASALEGSGRVIAVDADAAAIDKLERAARLLEDKSIVGVHAALSREDGTARFFVRDDRRSTTGQSLRPSPDQRDGSSEVEVPARTLTTIRGVHLHERLASLVKVDIEGAELEAISSAPAEWFGCDGPLWIVEINPGALARFGAVPADVVRRFAFDSFHLRLLPKHPHSAATPIELREPGDGERFEESVYYNLFAVPRGRRWAARRDSIRSFFEEMTG